MLPFQLCVNCDRLARGYTLHQRLLFEIAFFMALGSCIAFGLRALFLARCCVVGNQLGHACSTRHTTAQTRSMGSNIFRQGWPGLRFIAAPLSASFSFFFFSVLMITKRAAARFVNNRNRKKEKKEKEALPGPRFLDVVSPRI